jgi:hypothetical protein
MLNRLDGSLFATGRASFLDAEPGKAPRAASIYVRLQPEGLPVEVIALLDTGATWTIFDEPIARELGLLEAGDMESEQATLSTRFGTFTGQVVRTPVMLPAEEGESLLIDATIFVSPEWTFGNFLGYQGFLERLRFAVDPNNQHFFFGSSDE